MSDSKMFFKQEVPTATAALDETGGTMPLTDDEKQQVLQESAAAAAMATAPTPDTIGCYPSTAPVTSTPIHCPGRYQNDFRDRKLRVSPLTVKWLIENYETANGVSLPRSVLYLHYMQHCAEKNLDPVNAASFGKLIRSVFLGLRTRRLGTRGNSKYHYYGIRIKNDSSLDNSLLNTNDMMSGSISTTVACNDSGNFRGSFNELNETIVNSDGTTTTVYSRLATSGGNGTSSCYSNMNGTGSIGGDGVSASAAAGGGGGGSGIEAVNRFKSMLRTNLDICPEFPPIELDNKNFSADEIRTFTMMYRRLLELLILAIQNFDFVSFNRIWKEFWTTTEMTDTQTQTKLILTRSKLVQMCSTKAVLNFIAIVDTQFYLNIVHKLMPDVVESIPLPLIHLMKNFAHNMESWMITSLVNCSDDLKQRKLDAVIIFRDSFLRYLTLNRLAQAANVMFRTQKLMVQMVTDFGRIDFASLKREMEWTVQCDQHTIEMFQHDFEVAFKNRLTINQWSMWIRNLTNRVRSVTNLSLNELILKWSFYSTMIIRELTVSSAPSFGCFMLLRTFLDQFFLFILEEQYLQRSDH